MHQVALTGGSFGLRSRGGEMLVDEPVRVGSYPGGTPIFRLFLVDLQHSAAIHIYSRVY